ncbi:hypothetical protein [Paenibacillus donghaensis]|uniref:Uncharacterized protein n=1 Tax=Paenibacillus donghaensis TaxID=414771 RepID=A0A2Z2KSC3_9BACL|nr:hypothetical protein [Paenibacillus donghaensis]ASA22028.1 hypothetical protein B9T62_15350 [Paenibacillus donghaensis]
MSSKKRIEDEAGYQTALDYLTEHGPILDDPLPDPKHDIEKIKRIYAVTEQRIHEYKRGQMVLSDPGRRKTYEAAGVEVQEFKKS